MLEKKKYSSAVFEDAH